MAGNANSGRKAEKPFKDALRMELKDAGDDHKRLRRIASALISKAEDGDMQAIKELIDRVDGKATAEVNVTGNHTVTHDTASVSQTTEWLSGLLGSTEDQLPKKPLPN